MLSIEGGIIFNFTPFCPSLNIGGMKLDHFFHASKSSEDQKKKSSPKLEEFLSPKLSEDQKKVQRSSSSQMQTIVKLLGEAVK